MNDLEKFLNRIMLGIMRNKKIRYFTLQSMFQIHHPFSIALYRMQSGMCALEKNYSYYQDEGDLEATGNIKVLNLFI